MASKTKLTLALVGAASIGLSGCLTTAPRYDGNYANPAGRAPVTANPTPYSAALVCLGQYARTYNVASPRIAVGRIEDKTGKAEADGSGRKITLGGSEMAVSAFAKAGANLVERFDTSVSEMELKYANNKLISDSPMAGQPGGAAPGDYRTINTGQVPGSALLVVEAGDIGGKAELVKVFESAAGAGVFACYRDNERDLGPLIAAHLKAGGYGIARDALAYLSERLGGDRGVTRSELDKLMLYLGEPKRDVTLNDAMTCIGDRAASDPLRRIFCDIVKCDAENLLTANHALY